MIKINIIEVRLTMSDKNFKENHVLPRVKHILAATNSAPLFAAVCFEKPMSTYSVNTDVSYKVFAAITSCHSLMVYSKHL